MSNFTFKTPKKIDMIFVFALVTLFAATSFVLVLIGAKQYRFITDEMNENYGARTTSSYIAEKIRQNDTKDAINVSNIDGTPALSITSSEGDIFYTTHIYYYENALRELVVTEDSVFSLSSGQKIIDMQGFTPIFINNTLISIEVIDANGHKQTLYFNLHCNSGKEEL